MLLPLPSDPRALLPSPHLSRRQQHSCTLCIDAVPSGHDLPESSLSLVSDRIVPLGPGVRKCSRNDKRQAATVNIASLVGTDTSSVSAALPRTEDRVFPYRM